MKQTQVIFLTFQAGQSSTTASIYVPFKVEIVHTKAMSLQTGDLGITGDYVTMTSDLVNNAPLGSTFNNSTYSSGTIQNIENQFWNPQVIQGTYNFTLRQSNGAFYPASTGNDKISLIVEFNSEDDVNGLI